MKLHPNVVCGSDPSSYVAEGIFPLVGSPKVFRPWRGNRDSWWLPIVESGFRWRPISCRRSSLDPVYGVDGGQRALVQFWGACLVWGTCQRSTIAWLMTSCIQRRNKLVFGVSSSLDRHLSSRSLETFFYSLHHSSQQLLIHFQGLPVKCYKHFYFFASWTYFSHIRKLLCSWMNVELQQLCKCADIYFHNACFWSGTKPLLPRRETDCVKWTQPPALLFYPAVFFPCSPSPVLAFLFHPPPSLPLPITPICPLTLPRSSTRSPVSSDSVGRWQQRFKTLLLKTLHESVSSDSEVSDKTCNDIPPILSLAAAE